MGPSDRIFRSASNEILIEKFWSGSRTGSRFLVFPNEESVVVNPTVYFVSNVETICNYTGDRIQAGIIYSIELGYNNTVSIRFSVVNSSVFWIYNVYTFEEPSMYEPEDIEINYFEHLRFVQEVAIVCISFGMGGALFAFPVRSSTS